MQFIKKELYPKGIKFWKFSVYTYFPDCFFQMLVVLFTMKFTNIVIVLLGNIKLSKMAVSPSPLHNK